MGSSIDIRYVADLARLELSAEQATKLQGELGRVVEYIAELAEVDVTGVEPTAHAAALTNVWREASSFSITEWMAARRAGWGILVPAALSAEGSSSRSSTGRFRFGWSAVMMKITMATEKSNMTTASSAWRPERAPTQLNTTFIRAISTHFRADTTGKSAGLEYASSSIFLAQRNTTTMAAKHMTV